MTEQYEAVSVQGYAQEVIEAGTYPATLTNLQLRHGDYGAYAMWLFQPEGYEDTEVAAFSSVSPGRTAKGMEWARRVTGKSDAEDQRYGRDIKSEKRPIINWGKEELEGKPCRIVVAKNWDEDEEVFKNVVVNVLPPTGKATTANGSAGTTVEEQDEDFDSIPF